jgi:hypothetical protein
LASGDEITNPFTRSTPRLPPVPQVTATTTPRYRWPIAFGSIHSTAAYTLSQPSPPLWPIPPSPFTAPPPPPHLPFPPHAHLAREVFGGLPRRWIWMTRRPCRSHGQGNLCLDCCKGRHWNEEHMSISVSLLAMIPRRTRRSLVVPRQGSAKASRGGGWETITCYTSTSLMMIYCTTMSYSAVVS